MSFSKFFSKQARKPSGIFGQFVMSRIFDKGNAELNAFMKERLSLERDDRILEIGFGTGKLIHEMAGIADHGVVEGIDFSDTMVSVAKKKNKKYIADGRVKIRQGNFEEMSYRDNFFDKICTANTVYFWPTPENTVKQIMRILKPGGKFALAFGDREELEKKPLSAEIFRFYSQDDIKELLTNAGFTSADVMSEKGKSFRLHCAVAVK